MPATTDTNGETGAHGARGSEKRRCDEIIEKRPYPQARYVTSRRRCKNWACAGSTRCAVHGGRTWAKGNRK